MEKRKESNREEETSEIRNNINKKESQEKNQTKNGSDEEINNKEKTLKVSELLLKTIKNTATIFVLSSTTTVLNFLCNIPLLRVVSKESYGTVKVYLELGFSLINYIPRESIRRTSQKFCPDKDPIKEKKKYILTAQLNMLIMITFAIIGVFIFLCFVFFTNSKQLHNNLVQLIIYMICALVELSCEPIILYMNLKVENKFIPITVSSLSRIISNTILAVFFKLDLWSFTLSRIIGSFVYSIYIIYLGYFKYKINFKNFIPKDIGLLIKGKMKGMINIQYLREVFYQFFRISLLNLIIQNCEGLILSFAIKNTEEEKSDYSFVSQNFSLILRFFIEPVTDAFYILVNKLKYMEKKNEIKDLNSFPNNKEIQVKIEEKSENNIETSQNKIENNIQGKNEESLIIKEPNIFITLKVLKLFMKIFSFFGVILIPYYILFGINIIELIYGKKWTNNNIDKIGDSYTYYVIITSIFSIVESFANATNNSRQMDLSYISLIGNSCILVVFMYIFSRWDICGIILANVFSILLIINCHLYIVFCTKKNININKLNSSNSLIDDIKNFIKNCFISEKSLISTGILISFGFFIKKAILFNYSLIFTCCICGFLAFLNCGLLFYFEYKQFKANLEEIKSYN